MKKYKCTALPILILLALVFGSCEEVIEVDLDSSDPALVAEGVIEPGKPVELRLSYTSDYFSNEEPEYENEALAYLTDGLGNYDTLVYTGDGVYAGKSILGTENTTYTVAFSQHNNGYLASTSLLPASKIVDVWFEESTMQRPGEEDTSYEIHVTITNDSKQDNYYLFKFFINGELEDDNYSITNSRFYPDEDVLEYAPFRIDFEKGDQVDVVVYRLDEGAYNYFSQLNDLQEGGPGGGSTPYNPISNFGNKVLGYFYAQSSDSTSALVE